MYELHRPTVNYPYTILACNITQTYSAVSDRHPSWNKGDILFREEDGSMEGTGRTDRGRLPVRSPLSLGRNEILATALT